MRAPGLLRVGQRRPASRGEADGLGPVLGIFAALVGWSMRKSDGTRGMVGCLKKVYWRWLISPGSPCWQWPRHSPRTNCCGLAGRRGGLAGLMEGLYQLMGTRWAVMRGHGHRRARGGTGARRLVGRSLQGGRPE